MLRILNAIVGRAHWVYSISEVVFEFVKIQFFFNVKIQFVKTLGTLGTLGNHPFRGFRDFVEFCIFKQTEAMLETRRCLKCTILKPYQFE